MTYNVHLVPRALQEYDEIVRFLTGRSPQGARAWMARWEQVLADLANRPLIFSLAPESSAYEQEIRQLLFKTRRGRMYRAIFTVAGTDVFVLNIRGPGQDLLPPDGLGAIIR
jgi:plasmid stabilization system protein ParE